MVILYKARELSTRVPSFLTTVPSLGVPKTTPHFLTPGASSEIPKTICHFDNPLERLTEFTESCYTHCYGLLWQTLQIKIIQVKKYIGQSPENFQMWRF